MVRFRLGTYVPKIHIMNTLNELVWPSVLFFHDHAGKFQGDNVKVSLGSN